MLTNAYVAASSFDAQAIANVFHALAVLDMRDEPAMQLIDHMASTILRSRQTVMAAHDFNAQVNLEFFWLYQYKSTNTDN
jgi:hypothetical protein